MSRVLSLLALLLLAACGPRPDSADGSSVTVKLPPPKAAPAPGFSEPVAPQA